MNIILKISALFIMASLIPVMAQNGITDQLSVELTNPNKPGTLEINSVYGFIHIVGYSGKEVIVNATTNSALPNRSSERNGAGTKRISNTNPLGLSAEEENNQIKLITNSALIPVDLTIKVPQRFSLKLRTYDKGDITVENVIGDIEVNNVNGPITLNNIGGSVVANTYDRPLKASFQNVDTNKPMAFSSMGGRIDVSFPSTFKANLKLSSEQGDIFSDFDLDKNQAKTVRSNELGRNKITLDNWVYGKINGGGSEILIKNYLGNIYVKKSN